MLLCQIPKRYCMRLDKGIFPELTDFLLMLQFLQIACIMKLGPLVTLSYKLACRNVPPNKRRDVAGCMSDAVDSLNVLSTACDCQPYRSNYLLVAFLQLQQLSL